VFAVETEPVLVTTTNPSVDSGNQSEAVEDNIGNYNNCFLFLKQEIIDENYFK
jgi:hypothetical protein